VSHSDCEYIVGFISQKKCDEKAVGNCESCGIAVCQHHGLSTNEGFHCRKCLSKKAASEELEPGSIPVYSSAEPTDIEETYWDDLS
jgi:hypothetical protein